jgi:hypothetical protein
MTAISAVATSALALSFAPAPAEARPCEFHSGSDRTRCLGMLKRHARDRMAWPPKPTWRDLQVRARPGEIRRLRAIARCEQPGRGRWGVNWRHPGPRYVGGYGMYRGTYGIGASATGYRSPPAATPVEQTAVAMVVARRFGFSAWGCA